jgi:hypothetical protein
MNNMSSSGMHQPKILKSCLSVSTRSKKLKNKTKNCWKTSFGHENMVGSCPYLLCMGQIYYQIYYLITAPAISYGIISHASCWSPPSCRQQPLHGSKLVPTAKALSVCKNTGESSSSDSHLQQSKSPISNILLTSPSRQEIRVSAMTDFRKLVSFAFNSMSRGDLLKEVKSMDSRGVGSPANWKLC